MQTYPYLMRGRWFRPLLLGLLFSLNVFMALGAEDGARRPYDLPAGDAEEMLKQFAEQSGKGVLFSTGAFQGIKTRAVKGEFTAKEAIELMTAETALVVRQEQNSGAFAVRKETSIEAKNVSRASAESGRPGRSGRTEVDEKGEPVVKLDTFEVFGRKSLNMDIRRSRDDAQPYVVFDRNTISESGAVNLDDFFKARLTMNTQASSTTQAWNSTLATTSQVNLRGLGTSQTLILVDGRRIAGAPSLAGSFGQSDINGIPLAAIERIEVLPTTASGIYGGAATGGVINIILRRDYSGVVASLTYDNTFDTDSARRVAELTAGFTFEGGKTSLLLTASYADSNLLLGQDRDFTHRGLQAIYANNPIASIPPLGFTPNIRNSVAGQVLTLKPQYGGASLGSSFTSVPVGYTGVASDQGAALIANAGRYNLSLATTAQGGTAGRQPLLTSPTSKSASVTLRREFTPRLQVLLEAAANDNVAEFPAANLGGVYVLPSTATTNPFVQTVFVTTPVFGVEGIVKASNNSRRVVTGINVKLSRGWTAGFDYTWSAADTEYRGLGFSNGGDNTAVSTGQVDLIRDPNVSPVSFAAYVGPQSYITKTRSTTGAGAVRAGGPLWSLPAGALSFSALAEYSTSRLGDSTFFSSPTFISFNPSRSQDVTSGYAEAHVPLVSAQHRFLGLDDLEVQVAVRYDEYESESANSINLASPVPVVRVRNRVSSTNPTFALKGRAAGFLGFRASYGTGFLAPSVSQLARTLPGSLAASGVRDPRRGNELVTSGQIISGGNPDLQPERSQSWSAGVIIEPRFAPGLRLSVDWTRIEKEDNIAVLAVALAGSLNAGLQAIVNNESVYANRVVRAAVPSGDPFSAGPITAIDNTSVNISMAEAEAWDIALDYTLKTATAGEFQLTGQATWQTHYRTQASTNFAPVENVGVGSINPLKLKANFGVCWKQGRWVAGWNTRYFHSYNQFSSLVANQGPGRIPAQFYHDAFASVKLGREGAARGLWDNIELRGGVRNLFNELPPFDALNSQSYYSYYADPRLASYYLTLKKSF